VIAVEVGEQYDVDRVVRDAETLQGNKARSAEVDTEANTRRVDEEARVEPSPDPKESPVPTNVTLTDIGLSTVR
jgi:hypothetical protein